MNQNAFSIFDWMSLPYSPWNLPFWNVAAAEAKGNAEKIKRSCSLPGSRLPSQLLWWHPPPYRQTDRQQGPSALMIAEGRDAGRFGHCLEAKPFYPGIHKYAQDFRKIWGLFLVSLNTVVLFCICKASLERYKLPSSSLWTGVSNVYWSSEIGKLQEKQLWYWIPPKQLPHFDSDRNTLIGTLTWSQYEAAVKEDEVKNVTLLFSVLPSQVCFGVMLQHWWKTMSFKYIALKKTWQHWRSQTHRCTNTQVSEDRYKHKRPKKTRWVIPVAKPREICHFCTCWTNRSSP